ncbi:hypothetical protein KAFR_0I01010 [Kazachstania africana CBS 2517]|uniref:Methionyl-tRNA formyltransferase, mitochondrial n=1 Tax=Kazachstania africana (strain ATCC 22294 / BCRC 22015 / CBS 2517 / CECT 1963 / NBRC 1671 / NRRL Y-8276) TaxID=1071382 RepID=H2AZT2_KAZAF|nr:hypothetical protein KAFR_0I01010 [Kazachstania africana CBS 2517]CCF59882.1 hypothetical protein KAFR_0I01010 [Kazachstania africana CBS 2517]
MLFRIRLTLQRRHFHCTSLRLNEALDVLFFGTDEFSSQSLISLNNLKRQCPSLIDSIRVITKPPKWCGRRSSVLKTPPIVNVSKTLNLPIPITCNSKQEITDKLSPLLNDKTMIITSSFGGLIPESTVNNVPYTLNVHPSLLPRYKGSSPIQYTLLNNDLVTGVTIQTLHPTMFDDGEIIAQTNEINVKDLLEPEPVQKNGPWKTLLLMKKLGMISGKLLNDVITNKTYANRGKFRDNGGEYVLSLAPKIKASDKRIDWGKHTAREICNARDVFGSLYTFKLAQPKRQKDAAFKRVLLHEVELTPNIQCNDEPGTFYYDEPNNRILLNCTGSPYMLAIDKIQFEGYAIETCDQFMKRLRKRCGNIYSQEQRFITGSDEL